MSLKNWSTTAGSNATVDSINFAEGQAPSSLNDSARALMVDVKAALYNKGSDIASATTTDLAAASTEGLFHDITGTTTITGLGTVAAGVWKVVKFEGALTLTHNGTSLILPGAANITTADGDVGIFVSEGSGNWRCVSYMTAGIPEKPYGQIPFPATQVPSSDANTLDDYEEGTFTPSNANMTTGNGTNTGTYRKIGSMVHCWTNFVFGSTSAFIGSARVGSAFAGVSALTSLPIGNWLATDSGTGYYIGLAYQFDTAVGVGFIVGGGGTGEINATVPMTWTTNDSLRVMFSHVTSA